MGRALLAASLMVAAGVAGSQIYTNGKLSWSWGYLALVFTVLGVFMQATPPPAQTSSSARRPWRIRRAYLRRMRSSVNQMETIGLVTQAEFVLLTRQVYVDVMLQPKPVTDTVPDAGIGSAPPTEAGRRAPLATFLTRGRVLAVLGAAGSGKTTLARYTALELADQRWWQRRPLPVLLYLRDHAEAIRAGEPDNLAQMAAAAPWLCGAVPAEWLERRLARSQCVVLLDGLDEVADTGDRRRVVQWVEDQISRYPGNAFVITSRPLGYKDNRLSRADVLQVQRFTSTQIRAFLHGWYHAIEHRSRQGDPQEIDRIAARDADDLFRRISGRSALYGLAANPMLLTMIANVHRYRAGSLPGSRAALYEEMCQVLLHRRQEAKRLPDTDLEGLSGDQKERIVQELAWHMMRDRLRDIPVDQAENAIQNVLERTAPNLTPRTFLTHVRHSGLLLEHQHGQYGFAHLTLQEYLAAALVPTHASWREILVDNVSDSWWRETTLLWAARADASPVVEACLAARTPTALSLAYTCADEARELRPALRTGLDRILTTTPTNLDEIRLLDGVAAARALQETHTIDDKGTRICALPVPDDLWDRYNRAHGLTPRPGNPLTADIKGFLSWLNSLYSDGTSYRLPTQTEAAQALSSDLYPGPGPALYAADHDWDSHIGQARFVVGTAARHPLEPSQAQIDAYPKLVVAHAQLIFRLLDSRSGLPIADLLSYACPRDASSPGHRLLNYVDLAFELACARAYGHTLARSGALGFDESLDAKPASLPDPHLVLGLANDLGHVLNFNGDGYGGYSRDGHAIAEVVKHTRNGESLRETAGSSARPFDQAVAFVLETAADYDLVSDPAAASNVADVRKLADALASGRAPVDDPDHMDALIEVFCKLLARDSVVRGLVRPSLSALPPTPKYGYYGAITHGYELAATLHSSHFALTRARNRDYAASRTSYHAWRLERTEVENTEARATAVAGANALSRALGFSRDLAYARSIATGSPWSLGAETVVDLGRACDQLVRGYWASRKSEEYGRSADGSTPFERFLQRLVVASCGAPAAEPAVALDHARHLAIASDTQNLATLISGALRFVTPLQDGSRPVRQGDVVLAATFLLAALTLQEEGTADSPLFELLRGALRAFIALTPDTGPEPETATLVLVRN